MPDLHDELAAAAERRQPAHPPAFAQVLEMRRRRDRRRLIVAGTVLPLAVVALAVAVVPSLGADGDRLTPEPGPAAGPRFAQEDLPPDATVVGTARVEGALIDPADPTYLILSVAGAAPVPQEDPCWEGYRATLAEDGTKIVVEVARLQRVSANVGKACLGVGGTRPVGVELASPVGDRKLQDTSSGTTIRPFDGSRLLLPSYLPPGYRETACQRPREPAHGRS